MDVNIFILLHKKATMNRQISPVGDASPRDLSPRLTPSLFAPRHFSATVAIGLRCLHHRDQ